MRLIFLLLILVFSSVVSAVGDDLVKVKMPVKNNSAAIRQQAIAMGLAKVLTRLSGKLHQVDNALNGEQYLQSFYYKTIGLDYVIELNFDKVQLKDLLFSHDERLWLDYRPVGLVWFIGNKSDRLASKILNNVLQRCDYRGVKCIVSDVVDFVYDESWLQQQLNNYGADYHLIINPTVDGGGEIQVVGVDKEFFWNIAVANDAQAVFAMVDELVNYLVAESKNKVHEIIVAKKFNLQINGVDDLRLHKKVLSILKSYKHVVDLEVDGVAENSLNIKVNYAGVVSSFLQLLAQDVRFLIISVDADSVVANWVG